MVLIHYARLGVGEGELVFIQQVWSYWWDAALPFPSVATIAARMGKTHRQIQHYIRHLRGLGLLRVVERRDAEGGQLSNAYDLRPFLQAVEGLIEREAGPARLADVGISRTTPSIVTDLAAGGGVQAAAPGGMHPPAPEINPPEEDRYLISIPPYPRLDGLASMSTARPEAQPRQGRTGSAGEPAAHIDGHLPSADTAVRRAELPAAAGNSASAELQAVLSRLGRALGDSAPRSSITRTSRLQARYQLEEGALIDALEEVGRRVLLAMPGITYRGEQDKPNAMPYFFASVESGLAASRESRQSGGPRDRRDRRRLAEPGESGPAESGVGESSDAGLPVWNMVRAELQETLAPGVFARHVLPLRASLDPGGMLVLAAQTAFLQRWVELRLRPRIERILQAGSHDVRVLIVATGAAEHSVQVPS